MFILLPQLNSRRTINIDQTKPPIHMKPHKCTLCASQSQREVILRHQGGGAEANTGADEKEKLRLNVRTLQRGDREGRKQGGSCCEGNTKEWCVYLHNTRTAEHEWEMTRDRNKRVTDEVMEKMQWLIKGIVERETRKIIKYSVILCYW